MRFSDFILELTPVNRNRILSQPRFQDLLFQEFSTTSSSLKKEFNSFEIDMVYIPEGDFLMGSPENEAERTDNEGPQYRVQVPAFYMGKYPVTQAQWRAVAKLKKLDIDLKPAPFTFKGDTRPVETVSWMEAVEFCRRLSKHTGREYRLPSEAEWEYACRAGTKTPFHFGETITTHLANYNGDYTYGPGPEGEYRKETTAVGSFPSNSFGLHDMHGNVWEWCQDIWHEGYNKAPTDASAWMTDGDFNLRVLCGGSWDDDPADCRSACRDYCYPEGRAYHVGFRVVMETL